MRLFRAFKERPYDVADKYIWIVGAIHESPEKNGQMIFAPTCYYPETALAAVLQISQIINILL